MSLLVEHINKSFGKFQAVTDLSIEVEERALFGFLGANGAGKTIIFSTYQLEQVEELCEDVVIINKGQSVVQGMDKSPAWDNC